MMVDKPFPDLVFFNDPRGKAPDDFWDIPMLLNATHYYL
jgi:hypothetical protein